MRATSAVTAAMLLLGLTSAAGAQGVEPRPNDSAEANAVNVDQLPIDLARVQRGLRRTTIREERDGLRLKYFIDVYGQAPPLSFFTRQDNLLNGPVPYGAPTHKEMMDMITPQEFRAPVADFSALFRWLADKAKDKK
jgi:hypothetical protein